MSLSVKKIERLGEGRHHDGRGLYLQVSKSGSASWLYRYKVNGKEHWMGLGGLYDVDLEEARERAWNARQLLKKDKIDPLHAKKAERVETAKQITFEQAALDYFKGHEQKWSNEKHRQQFLGSLQKHAFEVLVGNVAFGRLPVAKIDTTAVLEVLKPIWYTKTVTAGRVRNRIESVLDWCTASGYRAGPNPAAWAGHLEAILPAKTEIAKVEHHRALHYSEIPAFMVALASRKGFDARAMEFLVLCAGRTSEIIRAKHSEIDYDQKIWTCPPERMKGRKNKRKAHRVPLSDRTVKMLKDLPREGDFIFVGSKKNTPISKNVLANLLITMSYADKTTVHGLRSSFRDWAEERTSSFSREVIEQCLAHKVGGDTELAYRRSDVLEKRRKLMSLWAAFCSTPTRDASVTPIRGAA